MGRDADRLHVSGRASLARRPCAGSTPKGRQDQRLADLRRCRRAAAQRDRQGPQARAARPVRPGMTPLAGILAGGRYRTGGGFTHRASQPTGCRAAPPIGGLSAALALQAALEARARTCRPSARPGSRLSARLPERCRVTATRLRRGAQRRLPPVRRRRPAAGPRPARHFRVHGRARLGARP